LSRDPKAIEIVQVILESVLLRREKSMKDKDGKPIVNLPSKTVSAPCAVDSILIHVGYGGDAGVFSFGAANL
jgi:hypothetical protein